MLRWVSSISLFEVIQGHSSCNKKITFGCGGMPPKRGFWTILGKGWGLGGLTPFFLRMAFRSSSRIFRSAPLSQKTLIWVVARWTGLALRRISVYVSICNSSGSPWKKNLFKCRNLKNLNKKSKNQLQQALKNSL